MLKAKEAYEVLGLSENTSREDIVKKYDLLLKKYRTQRMEGIDATNQNIDIEKINEAYNTLMGYKTEKDMVEADYKENPLLKKIGVDEKKTRNFLHYYKYHMVISIIAVILIAISVRGCVTKVKPDLNIAFIGSFDYGDPNILKTKIRNSVPGIKEPSIDGAYISGGDYSEQAYNMQMKAMVLVAAGEVDIYIVDKVNFDKFVKQGVFVNLDTLASELRIDRQKNKDYIKKIEEKQAEGQTSKEHLYGIDASKSSILKEPYVIGKEKIVAIDVRAKNYSNAVNFLKQMLK